MPLDNFSIQDTADRGLRRRIAICIVLAVIAFLLFIANKYVSVIEPHVKEYQSAATNEKRSSIDAEVETILLDFGLKKHWLSKREVTLGKGQFTRIERRVSITHDTSPADIIRDVTEMVQKHGGTTAATEDIRSGITTIHIAVESDVIETIVLKSDPTLRRDAGSLALIADGLPLLSETEQNRLLHAKDPIAFTIKPHRAFIDLVPKIIEAGRECFLIIPVVSEDDGERFCIAEDLKEKPLKSRLKDLFRTFAKVSGFIVVAENPKSSVAAFVREEISNRKLPLLETTWFNYLKGENPEQVATALHDLAMKSVNRLPVIGYLELRDAVLPYIERQMAQLRKRGFDFISVASALRERG
jgi:hypothetical protein